MSRVTSGVELVRESALPRAGFWRTLDAFLELSKFRLCSLVVMTTLVGFVLAAPAPFPWVALAWTLIGTGFAALGANALNQCIEADRDARMHRTCRRPIPAGILPRSTAWAFGLTLTICGPLVLLLTVGSMAAWFAASCALLYVLVYTPLKVTTPLNTIVGAVCGALPPVIGWVAARGTLDSGAWMLGALLFVWQIPHFLALAWVYREDYARGGYQMLPAVDARGVLTSSLSFFYSLALLPLSLLMLLTGASGIVFIALALPLAVGMAVAALLFAIGPDDRSARRLFFASIIYLPLLLGAMMLDRAVAETAGWRPRPSRTVAWQIHASAPMADATQTGAGPADVVPADGLRD